MSALIWTLILAVALVALVKGSDWFVGAAEKVGLALGIPAYIIGVTVVAFGTSLPELASSTVAVLAGKSEIVVGNAIGSNIANIALVLGITSVIGRKVTFNINLMDADIPLLICSAFLLWFVLMPDTDGIARLELIEAIILLAALGIFIAYSFDTDGSMTQVDDTEAKAKISPITYLTLLLSAGLLYLGAKYTVDAIIKISEMLQIQSDAIAQSVVALGTSLPEILVSVVAMKRGKPDIAIGNILGSNVFNTFAVVGIPGIVALFTGTRQGLAIPPGITSFSLPMMTALTLIFFFLMISKTVTRWEGYTLLLFYIYFIAALF